FFPSIRSRPWTARASASLCGPASRKVEESARTWRSGSAASTAGIRRASSCATSSASTTYRVRPSGYRSPASRRPMQSFENRSANSGTADLVERFALRRFRVPGLVYRISGAVSVARVGGEGGGGVGVRGGGPEIEGLLGGLVYGAAAGLVFSATEILIYGVNALLSPDGGA